MVAWIFFLYFILDIKLFYGFQNSGNENSAATKNVLFQMVIMNKLVHPSNLIYSERKGHFFTASHIFPAYSSLWKHKHRHFHTSYEQGQCQSHSQSLTSSSLRAVCDLVLVGPVGSSPHGLKFVGISFLFLTRSNRLKQKKNQLPVFPIDVLEWIVRTPTSHLLRE